MINILALNRIVLVPIGVFIACQLHGEAIAITNPNFGTVQSDSNTASCVTGGVLNNTSFIDANVGYSGGCLDSNPFAGTWTVSSGADAGVFNPTGTGLFSVSVPDGPNVAFDNGGASAGDVGTISQTLSSVLAAGSYTLTVNVGSRNDSHPLNNYIVELLAGGNVIASDNSLTPTAGTFGLDTIKATVLASNPDLGEALGIAFLVTKTNALNQADFSGVALDYETPVGVGVVPEPSSLVVCAAGAAAILFRVRSRRGARQS